MSTNLSVDRTLIKASSHVKRNEYTKATELYIAVLLTFPKNLRAQHALTSLKKLNKKYNFDSPPQKTVHQLINFYNQGQFKTVIEQALIITKQYPEAFIVWNILGASYAQIGMPEEAIASYNKTILYNPNYAEAYNNKGNALLDQEKIDEAIEAFKNSISLKPHYAEAYCNMGNALQNKGDLDKAVDAYNKAISLKPNFSEAYSNLGNIFQNNEKIDEAIEVYNKALILNPNNAEAYNNLANAFQNKGNFDKAIESFKKALLLKPNLADANYNLGNALRYQGKLDEAIESYNKAILIKPDYAEAYGNLGVVLKDQGKLIEAMETYKKALLFKPDYVEVYNNMGIVLKNQGNLDKAIESHSKALAIKPNDITAHYNLSFVLLNKGRLKEGFNKYEWRWKETKFLPQQRFFSKPMWDGRSLNGKRVLLWSEQGIGDTINWSSCLSLIRSKAAHCILECQEKLVPLLERSFPKFEVKAENRSLDLERDDFDFHLPMGSLYKYFIQDISEKASVEAFLVPDPVRVNYWKKRLHSLGKGPYIGISWKSFNMSRSRLLNYANISEWFPILTIPNVTFINLQYKDFEDDLSKIKNELGITIHNFDDLDHFNNLTEVAALSAALDVVVSIKNTVPIISAGVGTLTKLANWRQSSWSNVLFNPTSSAVDILEKNTWEPWSNVFNIIAKDIFKLKLKSTT